MQTGFLHLHKATVIIFMAIYIIKLIGLLAGVQSIKGLFAKKGLRIFEMVISTLFLVTGVYLFLNMPPDLRSTYLLTKILLVIGIIPVAIIGFKKENKTLAMLSVLGLLTCYGLAEMHKKRPNVTTEIKAKVSGAEVYAAANCGSCHGPDGKAMNYGAKNLSVTALDDAGIADRIMNGKNTMPPYKKQLSAEQVNALVEYVKSLKQ